MLIVMQRNATLEQINRIIAEVEARDMHSHLLHGAERTIIGVVGERTAGSGAGLRALPRRRGGRADLESLQADLARVHRARHDD